MKEFPTVSIEEAKKQTANWRNYYAEIYNGPNTNLEIDPDGENIFRGFRIPLEDLSQILKVIENYNENAEIKEEAKINSIRAYIAKTSPDINSRKDIHMLLVPVVGGKKIEPPVLHREIEEFGNDLLELETEETTIDSKYTIYNFTTPCPTECDKKSELYAQQKKVQ